MVHPIGYVVCLLVLIWMRWQQGSDIESKGDQLSLLLKEGLTVFGTKSQTDWMPHDKPTKLLKIRQNTLNLIARSYGQRAFSPLDPIADMAWPLALAIYMFVGVHFDSLATAKWCRIERSIVSICWMQDSKPLSLKTDIQQTECPLTEGLSYRE